MVKIPQIEYRPHHPFLRKSSWSQWKKTNNKSTTRFLFHVKFGGKCANQSAYIYTINGKSFIHTWLNFYSLTASTAATPVHYLLTAEGQKGLWCSMETDSHCHLPHMQGLTWSVLLRTFFYFAAICISYDQVSSQLYIFCKMFYSPAYAICDPPIFSIL